MGGLIRWEPFEDLVPLRRAMNRWVEGDEVLNLALDMYETDTDVVVKASLPGVKPDDIKVSVVGDVLSIEAETKSEEKVERKDYHFRERRFGKVSRSVVLPSTVASDDAKADFENGVLTLTLPKTEDVKRKTISIKAK